MKKTSSGSSARGLKKGPKGGAPRKLGIQAKKKSPGPEAPFSKGCPPPPPPPKKK